jgi:luciferase family oxidoreductase group 1
VTARALRRAEQPLSAADFPAQLAELRGYFAGPGDDGAGGQIRAIAAEGNRPAVWLLGSTGYSAEIAGQLGLPFAFAYQVSAANARPALALYRRAFRPSALLAEPQSLISVFALCARDSDTAHWLHGPARLSALRQRSGRPSTLPSPDDAARYPCTAAEHDVIAQTTASHVVGDPPAVAGQLSRILRDTGADELMVTTATFAHADRLASYQLLAQAMAGQPAPDVQPAG